MLISSALHGMKQMKFHLLLVEVVSKTQHGFVLEFFCVVFHLSPDSGHMLLGLHFGGLHHTELLATYHHHLELGILPCRVHKKDMYVKYANIESYIEVDSK